MNFFIFQRHILFSKLIRTFTIYIYILTYDNIKHTYDNIKQNREDIHITWKTKRDVNTRKKKLDTLDIHMKVINSGHFRNTMLRQLYFWTVYQIYYILYMWVYNLCYCTMSYHAFLICVWFMCIYLNVYVCACLYPCFMADISVLTNETFVIFLCQIPWVEILYKLFMTSNNFI